MDEGSMRDRDVTLRLDSLERFGFPRSEMDDFVHEHEAAMEERLAWLEDRRATASEIEDRLVAFSQHVQQEIDSLETYRDALNDPFSIEETYGQFERHMRGIASWEPPLNRWKHRWYEQHLGDSWALLYRRLAALDASSYGAVEPLHRLFESPERYDEVFRHLETVEADEGRQRKMMAEVIDELKANGYDVTGLEALSFLECLSQLDRWQSFHARREQLRLSIVQLIQPFDASLALEIEQRCNAMGHLGQEEALNELQTEVNGLAQTLEERRKTLSSKIEGWRQQGISFPHEGALHPSDLMEWEANHEVVAKSVDEHLALVQRWNRFAMYWPSRTSTSKELIGQLDQTAALQDVVDELDALWKKAELDGLDILQGYEHAGLDVAHWRQHVFEDPLNALERMMAFRSTWDRRVDLMNQLHELDVSFSGQDEVDIRLLLLASEELETEVLDEMNDFVKRMQRRHERHRIMLEEELAEMRRAGVLPQEVQTERMVLRELEQHVAQMQSQRSLGGSGTIVEGAMFLPALEQELERLQEAGWAVHEWTSKLAEDTVSVARSLSAARPLIEQHEVLRRRLLRLPWNRDITLASQVELQLKQPHRLASLMEHIPQWATHLSQREVEDAGFVFNAWQPVRARPTLVPVLESTQRPVLQPTTVLDDAHEAMLEAMEVSLGGEKAPQETEQTVAIQTPGLTEERLTEEEQKVQPIGTETVHTEKGSPVTTPQHLAEEHNDVPETAQPEVDEVAVTAMAPVAHSEEAEVRVALDEEATENALKQLNTLISLLGFTEMSSEINNRGLEAMQEVRRGLAQHVNVEPRDVRIARLLRLTLRLLPEGDDHDAQRAEMLGHLCELIPPLKRWMRRRLEARHSGTKGHFLKDARELGVALERIPGLGRRVPLNLDDWPLPQDIEGLKKEIQRLQQAVHLPSAGGVQA